MPPPNSEYDCYFDGKLWTITAPGRVKAKYYQSGAPLFGGRDVTVEILGVPDEIRTWVKQNGRRLFPGQPRDDFEQQPRRATSRSRRRFLQRHQR